MHQNDGWFSGSTVILALRKPNFARRERIWGRRHDSDFAPGRDVLEKDGSEASYLIVFDCYLGLL